MVKLKMIIKNWQLESNCMRNIKVYWCVVILIIIYDEHKEKRIESFYKNKKRKLSHMDS